MTILRSLTVKFFDRVILRWPVYALICLLIGVSWLGYHAKDFQLDASAETLVLEGDKDLKYARLIDKRYGVNDFLVITYTPVDDLLSDNVLDRLDRLQKDLERLEGVESVLSLLNIPLLESPPVSIKELSQEIKTLLSPTVNRELARKELAKSPFYQNLLVSPDLKTTAIIINFPDDKIYRELLERRDHYREKERVEGLSEQEFTDYRKVIGQFKEHRALMREKWHRTIIEVRDVMGKHRQSADLFLGGVSMIADDLISFIKSDLKTFGFGVFCFLIITLGIIFRKLRWVLLPMFCCIFSALSMMGLLGLFGWEVTVISSNFVSLQLIITMAITIHLIVRYRELLLDNPGVDNRHLVLETVRLKIVPCLYAALTTIAGFGSLIFCDIKPVIYFGWMMTAGIIVSLLLTFLFFPPIVMLMKKPAPHKDHGSGLSLLSWLAGFTERHGTLIIVLSLVILVLSALGISRLKVENSFIDYFKESTEIYQGMKVIDQKLGGTTPLDVIVDLAETRDRDVKTVKDSEKTKGEVFDDFDEFDQEDKDKTYWLNTHKVEQIFKIHDYLDAIPEIGKVLSLATVVRIGETLNKGKSLDDFELALLYNEIPDRYKNILFKPYSSAENNQLRFSARVVDSEKTLNRNKLLKQVQYDLTHKLGLKEESVHLTGMLVLYNNMLQSLFSSQLLTIGVVLLALMGMFLILFRSLKIALVAIFPNLLSVGVILGIMGWLQIPLDMMTITIAAISVGIAVDDTIHYIYRFKEEFKVDGNYMKAVHRCHGSIGYAIYYTSVTIIIGFSILGLSNFIPSIYFGLLTGLAMFIALVAALTLLPQLLVLAKPFGPGAGSRRP